MSTITTIQTTLLAPTQMAPIQTIGIPLQAVTFGLDGTRQHGSGKVDWAADKDSQHTPIYSIP